MNAHRMHRSDKATLAERFHLKVDRRSPDECWPWIGSADKNGRGQFSVSNADRELFGLKGGKMARAPRVAFYLHTGTMPTNALHTCDNPSCCNPAHLFDGTHQDNMDDMRRKGRLVCARQRLTVVQVLALQVRRAAGESLDALGAAFGISPSHASRVARGLHTTLIREE